MSNGAGDQVSDWGPSHMVPVVLGRDRASRLGGAAFAVFAVLSLAGLVAGVVWVVPGLALVSLVSLGLFGWFAAQALVPRLTLDEEGVRYRVRLAESGDISWADVASCSWGRRESPIGGGVVIYRAEVRTGQGRTIEVARGTALHPWTEEDMRTFTAVVRSRLRQDGD